MSDAADDPFGLAATPVGHETAVHDQMTRLLNGQEIALAAVPYVGLLIAIFGMSLLMLLLAPDRQRRALDTLRRAPLRSFLIGAALYWVPAFLLAVILAKVGQGRPRGQALLALYLFFSGCAGYAVCARALGERLLPDRGAVAQTLLGLLGLVLPLFSLLGLPVLLIAAPLGWGAWLTTGRKAPPPA
jgi:hypothetical protein